MTTTLNYDANGRYSANRSIDNFILGGQAADYKHVFIKDEAVPYCDKANKRICSPVMPTLIDERADRSGPRRWECLSTSLRTSASSVG